MKYTEPKLVDIWQEFVDWEKRKKGENGFLTSQLAGMKTVYDLCLGGGFDLLHQ